MCDGISGWKVSVLSWAFIVQVVHLTGAFVMEILPNSHRHKQSRMGGLDDRVVNTSPRGCVRDDLAVGDSRPRQERFFADFFVTRHLFGQKDVSSNEV